MFGRKNANFGTFLQSKSPCFVKFYNYMRDFVFNSYKNSIFTIKLLTFVGQILCFYPAHCPCVADTPASLLDISPVFVSFSRLHCHNHSYGGGHYNMYTLCAKRERMTAAILSRL